MYLIYLALSVLATLGLYRFNLYLAMVGVGGQIAVWVAVAGVFTLLAWANPHRREWIYLIEKDGSPLPVWKLGVLGALVATVLSMLLWISGLNYLIAGLVIFCLFSAWSPIKEALEDRYDYEVKKRREAEKKKQAST